MSKRPTLLILLAVLIALNLALFSAFRNRKRMAEAVWTTLANSPLDSYVGEKNDYRLRDALDNLRFYPDNRLREAMTLSVSFSQAIDSLLGNRVGAYWLDARHQDPIPYLKDRFAVPKSTLDSLVTAYIRFDDATADYVEQVIERRLDSIPNVRKKLIQLLDETKSLAEMTPEGQTAYKLLEVGVIQRSFGEVFIQWKKVDGRVTWAKDPYMKIGSVRYPSLFELLRWLDNLTPARAQTVHHHRKKLSTVFRVAGGLNIYGETYDLSSITRAELESAVKHLRILKNELDFELLDLAHELRRR